MKQLPATMQALAADGAGGVELVERRVPEPKRGQVLVRMRAAPINPNDLMALAGTYEVKKPAGAVLGFEGSGTVVANGGGVVGRFLVGRDVACAAGEGDGTWADYVVCDALKCAPLAKSTDRVQAAMMLTNPLTAWVLLETGRRAGHRAFVQNAAAGSLGKMLVRLCASERVPLVNVVRRPEQAEVLRAIGAEHVVVGDAGLAELCTKLGVTYGFDAIGGAATQQLAAAVGAAGTIVVYGMLANAPVQLDPATLVFRRLTIRGFTMYEWLEQTSLVSQLRTLRRAQRRLATVLRSEIRATFPLGDHAAALAQASGATSDGKILFVSQ